MKIVHLNFTFRQGGIPVLLVDITNEQVKSNQVSIIVINDQVHQEILAEVNTNVVMNFINRQPKSKNPFYVIKINYLLWRMNPDIIHCHSENCIKYLMPMFHRKAVLTVHDTLLQSPHHSRYRKVFAISKAVQQDVLSRFGVQTEKAYNGLNTANIKVRTGENKSDIFNFIQIGRLVTHKKGQHLAIEAIRKLVKDYHVTNIHLDFIGWGDDYEQLNNMVKEYHLESYIAFLGLKDRLYIYSHLCEYDLMIHPSLFEGFGINIAEAMAAKIPVLVSDSEGPMELIDNGKYGFYFKTGNIDDLTDKLLYFIQNKISEATAEIIENAYNQVITKFDIKNTVQDYMNGYKEVVNKG